MIVLSQAGALTLAIVFTVIGLYYSRIASEWLFESGWENELLRIFVANMFAAAATLAIYSRFETTPMALAIHALGWAGMLMSMLSLGTGFTIQHNASTAMLRSRRIVTSFIAFYLCFIPMIATAFTFS